MSVLTEERKKAFDAIDKDGSGLISFDEWYEYFNSHTPAGEMSEDELHCMFYAYDTAGDKEGIDINEYAAFMRDVYDPLPAA